MSDARLAVSGRDVLVQLHRMRSTRKLAPRPRQRLQPGEFAAVADKLMAAGCVARPGKPAAGERALGPALAQELGISLRRVRQLLAKSRLPAGAKQRSNESAALKAGRLALQRALGTKVDLNDQRGIGTIVVHFAGYEQLEELMGKLGAA